MVHFPRGDRAGQFLDSSRSADDMHMTGVQLDQTVQGLRPDTAKIIADYGQHHPIALMVTQIARQPQCRLHGDSDQITPDHFLIGVIGGRESQASALDSRDV